MTSVDRVDLGPISRRSRSIGAASDPYKKYWWAILGGFVLTGAWLCLPMMETPVGSVHVDATAKPGDAAGEQSLDSADNPNGAPGGALDLSMDGAKRKSKDGDDMASMLYQAPAAAAGAAAAGKPLGDATTGSSSSLAQQLKNAGKGADAAGWGEKAQSGFAPTHLAGGGLPGVGSVGSGGSSASAGGGGIFGTHNAQVGFAAAHGLSGAGDAESPGFQALKAAAGGAAAPNLKGSDEALHASMTRAFDGAQGKTPATIGADSGGTAMAQAAAALDAAPANLKANDPKLDIKKLPDPPAAPLPASSQNMGQELAMLAATALIGGMLPGAGGQMMMMGMMAMQQQQAAAGAAK